MIGSEQGTQGGDDRCARFRHPRTHRGDLQDGPAHRSKATLAALAARSHWLTPDWLAKYAPELSDIERCWKRHSGQCLAHKTLRDADHFDATIKEEIAAMNATRTPHPLANLRVSAWGGLLGHRGRRPQTVAEPRRRSGLISDKFAADYKHRQLVSVKPRFSVRFGDCAGVPEAWPASWAI
jgi:hypothetical protein